MNKEHAMKIVRDLGAGMFYDMRGSIADDLLPDEVRRPIQNTQNLQAAIRWVEISDAIAFVLETCTQDELVEILRNYAFAKDEIPQGILLLRNISRVISEEVAIVKKRLQNITPND